MFVLYHLYRRRSSSYLPVLLRLSFPASCSPIPTSAFVYLCIYFQNIINNVVSTSAFRLDICANIYFCLPLPISTCIFLHLFLPLPVFACAYLYYCSPLPISFPYVNVCYSVYPFALDLFLPLAVFTCGYLYSILLVSSSICFTCLNLCSPVTTSTYVFSPVPTCTCFNQCLLFQF